MRDKQIAEAARAENPRPPRRLGCLPRACEQLCSSLLSLLRGYFVVGTKGTLLPQYVAERAGNGGGRGGKARQGAVPPPLHAALHAAPRRTARRTATPSDVPPRYYRVLLCLTVLDILVAVWGLVTSDPGYAPFLVVAVLLPQAEIVQQVDTTEKRRIPIQEKI